MRSLISSFSPLGFVPLVDNSDIRLNLTALLYGYCLVSTNVSYLQFDDLYIFIGIKLLSAVSLLWLVDLATLPCTYNVVQSTAEFSLIGSDPRVRRKPNGSPFTISY